MNQGIRLTVAFVLSFVVLFVFYRYYAPKPQLTNGTAQVQTVADQPGTPEQLTATQTGIQKQASAFETIAPEKDVAIETPTASIILTTKGGVLKSYELKNYRRTVKKDAALKNLLTETPDSNALFLGLKEDLGFNKDKIFKITKDETAENTRTIALEWQNNQIRIEKTFVFGALSTPYAAQVSYKVTNLSHEKLSLEPYFENTIRQKTEAQKRGGFLSSLSGAQSDLFARLYFKDNKLNNNADWKGFTSGMLDVGGIAWTAVADRYFILALIPDQRTVADSATNFDRQDDFTLTRLILKKTDVAPGESLEGSIATYVGPKILGEMAKLGVRLEASVDYGWFKILASPILWLMTFLHRLIPSWGVVIIALTVIIKLILHPVNKKSMTSMKAMQQLQPKLKELRTKYANDKPRQNQEVMQLFKTHKVNPMGGCLPMALQMPIYIILYKVLWNAVELYHAPFLWYKDMSAPDPYYIAPILMGVSMVLQQKLTPSATGDDAQQKMMMWMMPIMFTALMLFLPVGLVVYIFANTAISVVQQYLMRKNISLSALVMARIRGKKTEELVTHHRKAKD